MTIAVASVIFAALMILITKVPVGAAMNRLGGYDNKLPREQQAKLTGFGRRAMGAHENAIEAFPVFAAGVCLALWANAPTEIVATLCLVWCASRIAFTIFYWVDVALLRTLVWFVGLISAIWLMALAL